MVFVQPEEPTLQKNPLEHSRRYQEVDLPGPAQMLGLQKHPLEHFRGYQDVYLLGPAQMLGLQNYPPERSRRYQEIYQGLRRCLGGTVGCRLLIIGISRGVGILISGIGRDGWKLHQLLIAMSGILGLVTEHIAAVILQSIVQADARLNCCGDDFH